MSIENSMVEGENRWADNASRSMKNTPDKKEIVSACCGAAPRYKSFLNPENLPTPNYCSKCGKPYHPQVEKEDVEAENSKHSPNCSKNLTPSCGVPEVDILTGCTCQANKKVCKMGNHDICTSPSCDLFPSEDIRKLEEENKKEWRCPCGKPAEMFDLCGSAECQEKYTSPTVEESNKWECCKRCAVSPKTESNCFECPCHSQERLEEELTKILNEADSRKDLGEKWAIAEISSLISLKVSSALKQGEAKARREVVEIVTNWAEINKWEVNPANTKLSNKFGLMVKHNKALENLQAITSKKN